MIKVLTCGSKKSKIHFWTLAPCKLGENGQETTRTLEKKKRFL